MADTLKDAVVLFSNRKYSEVIRILEPQVFRYRDDFDFYYMLAVSCINTGDFGGGFSYIRRALDLREDDVGAMLALAVIYLKRGDTSNALRIWLDVSEIDPNNQYAQRGLNFLRKAEDPASLESITNTDKLLKFLPKEKPPKKGVYAAVVSVFSAAVVLAALYFTGILNPAAILSGFGREEEKRPELPRVYLEKGTDLTQLKGESRYILTDDEIDGLFKSIQDRMYEYRDNLAMRDINRILLSNASDYVKEKARLLAKYVSEPDFSSFRDNFQFSEVAAEPLLYEGCYVLWKGKATNIETGDDTIRFDFLAGYHDEKILEGIVPVSFDFAIRVPHDSPMELLAEAGVDENGRLILKGLAIHRL